MSREDAEVHIAGVLVMCQPLQLLNVQRALAAIQSANVERMSADGKLVVIVEATSSRAVLDAIDAMRACASVLDVALVYQHAEPASAMDQEIEP